jgi:hypothetical protein
MRRDEHNPAGLFIGIEQASQFVKQEFVIRQTVQVIYGQQFAGPDLLSKRDHCLPIQGFHELMAEVLSGHIACGFLTTACLPVTNQTSTQVSFSCPTWAE